MPHEPKSDIDWIIQKLAQRGVTLNRPCPECGQADWMGDVDLYGTPRQQLGETPETTQVDLNWSLLSFVVACNNCGYLRHFGVNKLGFSKGVSEQRAQGT